MKIRYIFDKKLVIAKIEMISIAKNDKLID